MDKCTFDRIANMIIELTGNHVVFEDLELLSYDEETHHAVIQVREPVCKVMIQRRYTHEVIQAFDSVLGVTCTVSCEYAPENLKKPHERFIH